MRRIRPASPIVFQRETNKPLLLAGGLARDHDGGLTRVCHPPRSAAGGAVTESQPVQLDFGTDLAPNFAQVAMVGQIDRLANLTDLRQEA